MSLSGGATMAHAVGWQGSYEARSRSKATSAVYLVLLLAFTTAVFCTLAATAIVVALASIAKLN
jgi:hypothetical protein